MPEPLAVPEPKAGEKKKKMKSGRKIEKPGWEFFLWRAQLNLRLKWGREKVGLVCPREKNIFLSCCAPIGWARVAVAQVGGWFYKRNCAHLWESVCEHTGARQRWAFSQIFSTHTTTSLTQKPRNFPTIRSHFHHLKFFFLFLIFPTNLRRILKTFSLSLVKVETIKTEPLSIFLFLELLSCSN